MTLFDYVAIIILGASTLLGVLRGLVREILSLLVWIAAVIIASLFGGTVAQMLPAAVAGETVRLIVGFLVLLVGIILIGALLNMLVAQVIRVLGLQLADKGLGAVFGLVRGVLIILTLVLLAGLTSIPQQPFWKDSLLAPVFEQGARLIKPLLSEAWAAHVKQ